MQRLAINTPRSSPRRRHSPLPSLLATLLLLLGLFPPAHGGSATTTVVKSYVPITYEIPNGQEECLYERIAEASEHLTASVFLLSGERLVSSVLFEGPVAPPMDLDNGRGPLGRDLQRYLQRYDKEGPGMFVNGKFGDEMVNVKPVRVAEVVNFEEEEEDYLDDFEMTERQRKEFNAHHDREHQHEDPRARYQDDMPPAEKDGVAKMAQRAGELDAIYKEMEDIEDDYVRERETAKRIQLMREVDMEAELDDDFVKLQTAPGGPPQRKRKEPRVDGDAPPRRKIVDGGGGERPRRRLSEEPRDRRRLGEEIRLVAGEPYQNTVLVESPGWYRLCVSGASSGISVEMELRKSSAFGKVDPRTGHVPYLTEVETHSEIRGLFTEEDDEEILAEEGGLKAEDLHVTKEQIRVLERVYGEITTKQLEERRTWNWRTIKNQHLYSHLVLDNLVETIVYMGITGWQVYTIRKWFGGGPALGR